LLAPIEPAARVSPVEALIAPLPQPAVEVAGTEPVPDPISEPVAIPEPAELPPLPAPIPLDIIPVLKPRRVLAPAWSREALPRRLAVAIAVAMLCAVTLMPASARLPRPDAATGTIVAASVFASDDASLGEARRLFALLPIAENPGVVVRRGETLWSISARSLGDARRWTELWSANRGRAMAGGERFMNPAVIRPGWRLKLPRST
jgi:nucleoid-associated protein YgaU